MEKEKLDNNIIIGSESSDPEFKKTMRNSRKYLLAVITIAAIALVIGIVFVFCTVRNLMSDPIVRFAAATQKTVTAYSATIDATVENAATNGSAKIDGSYQIDPENKQLSAELNIKSKSLMDKNSPETNLNFRVSCEEKGGTVTYIKDGKKSGYNIDAETAEQIFDTFSNTKSIGDGGMTRDWERLINESGLEDYINPDKMDSAIKEIYDALSSEEGRELALGITEVNEDGNDIICFKIDPYMTANIILENGEPVFKNSEDYEKCCCFVDKYESFLNNVLIKCDVKISEDGFINEINADNFGIKFNMKITDINNS